ncbi:hypothetical protein ABPG72_008842 [Tetrahymena utriculariae]
MKQTDIKEDNSSNSSKDTADLEANTFSVLKKINVDKIVTTDIMKFYLCDFSPSQINTSLDLSKYGSQELQSQMEKSNGDSSFKRPLSLPYYNSGNNENILQRQYSISIETKNTNKFRFPRIKKSDQIEVCLPVQEEDEQSRKIWILYRLYEMQLNLNDAEQYLMRIELHISPKEYILQQTVEYCLLIKEMHFKMWSQYYSKQSGQQSSKYIFPQFLINNKKQSEVLPISTKSSSITSFQSVTSPKHFKQIQMQTFCKKFKRASSLQNSINFTRKLIIDGMTCSICCQENIDTAFMIQASNECKHIFCQSCLYLYAQTQIENGNVSNQGICCPQQNCTAVYQNAELRTIVQYDPKLYNKYLKFKAISQLKSESNILFCIKTDCQGFMVQKPGCLNLECPTCKSEICSRCFTFWHQGLTCQDALLIKYGEMKSNEIQCPKCCNTVQQYARHLKKDKIYCTWCHYKFCKLCKQEATYLHYNKYNCIGRCSNKQFLPISIQHLLIITLKYLFLFLIGCFIYPIYLIVMGICLPLIFYFNLNESTFGSYCLLKILLLIMIGIIFFPIWVLLSIAPGTCILINKTKHNMLMQNQSDEDDDYY